MASSIKRILIRKPISSWPPFPEITNFHLETILEQHCGMCCCRMNTSVSATHACTADTSKKSKFPRVQPRGRDRDESPGTHLGDPDPWAELFQSHYVITMKRDT